MTLLKRKISGLIGYYELSDWWLTSFNDQERKFIIRTFQPLGSDSNTLTIGEYLETSESRLSFLSSLAIWFKKPETYQIAKRIIEKAEEYVSETKHPMDIHFHYQHKLEIYYRNRETEPCALEKAITACEQQISLSEKVAKDMKKEFGEILPMHKGFQQLAIIREKQKDYEAVIRISGQALKEGWGGDWEKRIEKAKKKLGI